MKKLFLLFTIFIYCRAGAQTITSITPNQGNAGTTMNALITGQNTFFQTGSPQGIYDLHINNSCGTASIQVMVNNIISDDSIQVVFIIPPGYANGVYDVVLKRYQNSPISVLPASFTVTGGTTYSLQGVTPDTVYENSIDTLYIFGQNLQAYSASPGFYKIFYHNNWQIPILSWTAIHPDTIRAIVTVPLYIDTGWAILTTHSSVYCFDLMHAIYVRGYYPKQLVSISPNTGVAGTTLHALVTGQNTFFMSGSPQGIQHIYLKDSHCHQIEGTVISIIDDNHFNGDFNISSTAVNGVYDLYVLTPVNHLYKLPSSVTITGGITLDVTGFTPTPITAGNTIAATITGSGLDTLLSGNFTMDIVNAVGYHLAYTNLIAGPTQATLNILVPIYADSGFYDIIINSPKGCYTLQLAFEVQGTVPRGIISIVPDSACRGESLTALITGTYTFFMSGSPQNGIKRVIFNHVTLPDFFVVNPPDIAVIDSEHVSINMTVPFSVSSGWYDVTVETYGSGSYTLDSAFFVKGVRIGGHVYFDTDSNGLHTTGEPYQQGISVILLPDSEICITNSLGEFNFCVDSGQYIVAIVPDTNWIQTSLPVVYTLTLSTGDTIGLLFGLHPTHTVFSGSLPDSKNNLLIIPNPASGKTFVYFENNSKNVNAKIYNVEGQLVRDVNTKNNFIELNVEDLKMGMYFLIIQTERGERIKGKLIVER